MMMMMMIIIIMTIIIIIVFFINMQVQGQHPHQWAPFQVAGLMHAWQIDLHKRMLLDPAGIEPAISDKFTDNRLSIWKT